MYNHIVLEGRLQTPRFQIPAVNREHAAAARGMGAARSSQPTVESTVTCIAPPPWRTARCSGTPGISNRWHAAVVRGL